MLLDYLKTCKAQIFNRGQSAKIFKEVHDTDRAICVIKNSEPYIAILKHETYIALLPLFLVCCFCATSFRSGDASHGTNFTQV